MAAGPEGDAWSPCLSISGGGLLRCARSLAHCTGKQAGKLRIWVHVRDFNSAMRRHRVPDSIWSSRSFRKDSGRILGTLGKWSWCDLCHQLSELCGLLSGGILSGEESPERTGGPQSSGRGWVVKALAQTRDGTGLHALPVLRAWWLCSAARRACVVFGRLADSPHCSWLPCLGTSSWPTRWACVSLPHLPPSACRD